VDKPLLPQSDFNGVPHPWTGFLDSAQVARGGGDQLQFPDQGGTLETGFQMSLLFGAAAVFDFRQAVLQLNAIHTALSPSPAEPAFWQSVYCRFRLACSCSAPAKVTAGASLRWLSLLLNGG